MSVAVVAILITLLGSRGVSGWLHSCAITAKHGWLLWETTAAIATNVNIFPVALVAATDECMMKLYGGIAVEWGLLADSQADLLDVCQLTLHCGKACSFVLDGFLHGGACVPKVCKQFAVRCEQCIVIHSGHALAMICGQDGDLV